MAELLAPAGNPEALDAAMAEGADAVYLGLKSFNARLRSSNFAWSQFEATVEALHKRGKKVLVTVNTVLQESETERMYRFLGYLDRMGPDGIIVQDFGVLNLARTYFPNLRIHASTQMNIASAKAANAMSRAGVSRVVLARELGLSEVQDIRQATSCELEVFVHGALCVSESGLCLFSSFLGGKSANRGMCTQACRRLYNAEVAGGTQKGYYFSPNDLQLIDRIPDLVQAGVNSFKIEGRMKSAEYVGTVVSAYRYVLDNWENDKKGSLETARRILANDFARAKTRYWYDSSKAENVLNPSQAGGTGISLGKIDKVTTEEDGRFALLKGGTYEPDVGDSIRLHKKDDSGRESHKVQEVRIDGQQRWIDIPVGFGSGDSVYLIQTKSMSKRYPRVLTKELGSYRSQPGGDKLPHLTLETPPVPEARSAAARSTLGKRGAGKLADFPDGVYVQVSTIEDLYSILSDRPVRAILELTSETIPALLGAGGSGSGGGATRSGGGSEDSPVIPFSRRELILSLDPFLPQAIEESLSKTLDDLVEIGYSHFIVNNPGHIGMLRNRGLKLIAGPYLYTFNRWAVDWLTKQGLYTLITPLENSRENLEASIDSSWRSQVFVTVYAYPALFRMRFTLPEDYKFTYFSDRQSGSFKALSTPDGSFVFPEQPFALTDKTFVLKKAGFHRYLVDFSKTKVDRKEYRSVMDSMRKNTTIEEVSRFNWKEGFYDPDKIEEQKAMTERSKARKPAEGKQGRQKKGGAVQSQGKSSGAGTGAGRKSSGSEPRAKSRTKPTSGKRRP